MGEEFFPGARGESSRCGETLSSSGGVRTSKTNGDPESGTLWHSELVLVYSPSDFEIDTYYWNQR